MAGLTRDQIIERRQQLIKDLARLEVETSELFNQRFKARQELRELDEIIFRGRPDGSPQG